MVGGSLSKRELLQVPGVLVKSDPVLLRGSSLHALSTAMALRGEEGVVARIGEQGMAVDSLSKREFLQVPGVLVKSDPMLLRGSSS